MVEILMNLTIGNIQYLIVNAMMISGVLYVSLYSLAFSNKKIVGLVYNSKPSFIINKQGGASNIPIKRIRLVVKEKVTFFIGMVFSAIGTFLQCILEVEKFENYMVFFRLILLTIVVITVMIYLIVTIIAYFKVNSIVKALHDGKLVPDEGEIMQEY